MLYELMGIMAAAPAFLRLLATFKSACIYGSTINLITGKKEEEGNPGEHDPEEFNTRDDG